MNNFFNVLAEFFKKNKTLYFIILSLTTIFYLNKIKSCGLITIFGFTIFKELCIGKFLSIENTTISQTFLIIAILLTSFTVTRILLYINIISFILRLPFISDVIFYFGYKERKVKGIWKSIWKGILKSDMNLDATERIIFRRCIDDIKKHNVAAFDLNLYKDRIPTLVKMLKYLLDDNIILDIRIVFEFKEYNLIQLNDYKNSINDFHTFFDSQEKIEKENLKIIQIYGNLNPVIIRELDIEEYGYW